MAAPFRSLQQADQPVSNLSIAVLLGSNSGCRVFQTIAVHAAEPCLFCRRSIGCAYLALLQRMAFVFIELVQ
jgi:hypothetical protein